MIATRNPITVCLYTSTKGHFDRHDIYQRTVDSLLSQVPAPTWGRLLAHIKYPPMDFVNAEDSISHSRRRDEMGAFLRGRGFEVEMTAGAWKHGEESHQVEYIRDMIALVGKVTTPYILHAEDDWSIRSYDTGHWRDLEYWLHRATDLLHENPHYMQVRIPRYSNELDRINRLRAKHGIDGEARWAPGDKPDHMLCNDWSNHPYIIRTRDLWAALMITMKSSLPKHSEHGVGAAIKMLGNTRLPLVVLNPANIRCGHMGVANPSDEDNLDQPLLAD